MPSLLKLQHLCKVSLAKYRGLSGRLATLEPRYQGKFCILVNNHVEIKNMNNGYFRSLILFLIHREKMKNKNFYEF